jgi:hypothetical protein
LAKKKSREATHESSWQVPKNFERILRAFRGRDSWRRTSEAHLLKTSARFARIVFLEVLRVLYFLNSRAEPLLKIFTVKRTDHFRVRPVERVDDRV